MRYGDGQPNLEVRQDGTANAVLTPNGGRAGIGVGAIGGRMTNRPGLNEMLRTVTAEADRLYTVECTRKKAGFKPDPRQLRKVEVLDAAGDLLARIIPVVDQVSKIVRQVEIKPYRREGL